MTAATLLLLAGALLPAAAAAPRPQLALEVIDLGERCDGRRCTLRSDDAAGCRFALRACVAGRRGAALSRLDVQGSPPIADTVRGQLNLLPGAQPTRRGARFRPPLRVGCAQLGRAALEPGGRAQFGIGGRALKRRMRATALALVCEPPDPDRPPPPPPPDDPPPLRFTRTVLDPEGGGQLTSDVAAGDLDGDGAPDVVVSGFERLLFYHAPSWQPLTVAAGAHGRGADLVLRDVDRDGRLDVITGDHVETLQTVWLRNGAAGWSRHVISAEAYCHDLVGGDLDGDGVEDAVCLDQQRGRIAALWPEADPTLPWRLTDIDARNVMGAALADIDRDGRLDLVAGRSWYRNAGDGTWPRVELTDVEVPGFDAFRDYAEVSVLDLDGDGRLDVVATLYAETPVGQLWAFLAPPDPSREPWRPVLVDPGPLFGVHSQAAADFDGTGAPQVFVGETNIAGFDFGVNPSPELAIYRVNGPADDPAAWDRTVIDTIGTHEAEAADLDGDGRPDLVGHEENTDVIGRLGAVHLWRNVTGDVAAAAVTAPACASPARTADGPDTPGSVAPAPCTPWRRGP